MFNHVEVEALPELKTKNIDGKRHYVISEDKYYPSVTTVMSKLPEKVKGLQEWRKRVGDTEADRISAAARQRVTRVHQMVENHLNNDDVLTKLTDIPIQELYSSIDMFKSIEPHLNKYVDNIYAQEVPLYSDHLQLAGRCDCIAEFDAELAIIDFKTSIRKKDYEWLSDYFMQECAYSIMWEERTGQGIGMLVTIITVQDSPPQIFCEHRDRWVQPLQDAIKNYSTLVE